jgi:bilirubin oxidase
MKGKSIILGALLAALGAADSFAFVPGGTLDPTTIQKYKDNLPILGTMPNSGTIGGSIDYYIAAHQFNQQILPTGFPMTTVWGYGSLKDNIFTYPARTIEAKKDRPVQVKWINDLKASNGNYLPHLLPIDQTLHWANPPQDCIGGMTMPDCRGTSQLRYIGPVPLVTHLHGAHVGPDSDGYPEAWFLPNANNILAGYATKGSHYDQIDGAPTEPGQALYQYPNDQRATALWYHDHALGMTRANVYTGLAGFYLIRDPAKDPAGLPKGDHEVPLLIQDKSFNTDGSLFFPDNRAFFEGVDKSQLQIPFIPEQANGGISDVAPIWNPEFFGNTIVVNGKTWPQLNVDASRYRLRIVNGNDTRMMILKIVSDKLARPGTPAVPFWQIGADGGYLPKPVKVNELLIAPAERVDLIVDFTNIPKGTQLYLINEGPDEPFGGGRAPDAFDFADPATTGQVMRFIVVGPPVVGDSSTPPASLTLPARTKLGTASKTRTVSLNEAESETVQVVFNDDGSIVFAPNDPAAVPFAPVEALLGTASVSGKGIITPTTKEWMDPITENPILGHDGTVTEVWEIYDFTEDAHPIHIHQTQFEVINRQALTIAANGTAKLSGSTVPPEAGETGTKDTVLVYPGMVTRVKAKFDIPGLYVWHCHILSHEDNEMMRPMCVGPLANCQ